MNYRQPTQIALIALAVSVITLSVSLIYCSLKIVSTFKPVSAYSIAVDDTTSEIIALRRFMTESLVPVNDIFKTGNLSREKKHSSQSYQKFKTSMEALEVKIKNSFTPVQSKLITGHLATLKEDMNSIRTGSDTVYRMMEAGQIAEARIASGEIIKIYASADLEFKEMQKTLTFSARESLEHAIVSADAVKNLAWAFACIFCIIGCIIVLWELKHSFNINREMELLKLDAKKSSSMSKSKNAFLANLTHQVRTSLNTIIGFSELLRKSDLTPIQKNYIQNISNSSDDLLAVVNDVLDLSKIESGSLEIVSIPFRIDYVIQSIADQIRIRLLNADVDININSQPGMPTWFEGDPTRLRQILLNLMTNAAKFTTDGSITINVKSTLRDNEAGLSKPKHMVKVDIVDTGCGIPEAKLDKLFKALDDNSKDSSNFGEAGIGLSATKRITELMGGVLTASSVPGEGSTFSIAVPLSETSHSEANSPMPADMNHLKDKKLIIVDSDESTKELLQDFAEHLKMNLLATCESGDTLLSSAAGFNEVDLVLLDMNAAGANSKELLNKTRSVKSLENTQFIAMCLNAVPGSAFKAESAGYDAFIPKPISRRDLIKVILMTLGDKGQTRGRILTKHNFDEIQLTKMNIALAEDNPVSRALNEEIMKKLGCKYKQVANGKELVELLKEDDTYDACIIDIDMPVMNGMEAAKAIRVDLANKLPIIAVTAGVMNNEMERAKQSGINEIRPKPVAVDKLRSLLIEYSIQIEAPSR